MTERMIENRVKKLSALEKQIAQLQEQADAIKGELKADLEEKGLDELPSAMQMHILKILKIILNDAVTDEVIMKNPAEGVKALKEISAKAAL